MRKWLFRLFGVFFEVRWHVLRYRADCWEMYDSDFASKGRAQVRCAVLMEEATRLRLATRYCVSREIVFETRYELPPR